MKKLLAVPAVVNTVLSLPFIIGIKRENSFNKKQQEQHEIMRTISDTYIDIAYMNLKDYSFDIFQIAEVVQKNITETGVDEKADAMLYEEKKNKQ